MTEHRCETCGARVRVESSAEGTRHYVPVADEEVERLRGKLTELREAACCPEDVNDGEVAKALLRLGARVRELEAKAGGE